MRTLIHLSDLHFGRVNPVLLEPLVTLILELAPDVVVISGDLTQRARTAEFVAARAFLDRLPGARIVVPGNHDISLHNFFERFVNPLGKYQRHIAQDLSPVYVDEEIAIAGVNTARSLTIKDGRINNVQIETLQRCFDGIEEKLIRVVVSHHPFDLPDRFHRRDVVRRAAKAVDAFADCGADLLLAGHMHASHAGTTAAHYPDTEYAALVVQAGTATSTRGRGEANSFNVIRIDNPFIRIERREWHPGSGLFVPVALEHFRREGERWIAAPGS